MTRPPMVMFGVPIGDLTMDELLVEIAAMVDRGRRTGATHQIATVNVDFLVNALDDPSIARVLARAELCIADGMPIVWGARLLGTALRERVAGADLVPALFERSAATGLRVHVFGSAPEVVERSRRLVAERWPGSSVSLDAGPMIRDVAAVDQAVIDSIRGVDPDVLCVALGNPKQERFIEAHRERLGVPVMIGVGGSLDMLVGERRRAPRWMQRSGLEWVARAVQEPGRLGRRYAHDIAAFVPAFAGEYRRERWRRGVGLSLRLEGDVVEVVTGGERRPSASQYADATARLRAGAALEVRVDGVPLDRQAAGMLVGLVQAARFGSSSISDVDASLAARLTGDLELDPWLVGHVS